MSNNTVLPRLTQLAASMAVVVGGLAFVPAANAAAPAAGTNISNIATASYSDGAGRAQTVTSNIVQATVIQVASFTLEAPRNVNATPNGQVSLPHTLTNLGNGSDTFTIDVVNTGGDTFDFSTIKVYRDADGNGQPDDNNDLSGKTVTLAAGQALNLVVVTTVPSTKTSPDNGKLIISAQSSVSLAAGEPVTAHTKSNTDTVNVTSNAIINVNKSITGNISAVKTGDILEYVLTYTNTGNSTATNVILKDTLPDNVVYKVDSGRWSTGATTLTDAVDADKYKFDATTGEISFVVDSVAPGTTGTLKFKVTVGAASKGAASTATGAYVPAGQIQNKALFSYDPDGAGTVAQTAETVTNASTVTVTADYSGAINESSTNNYKDSATPPAGLTDSQTLGINQGQTATFTTYVWNRGNTAENYNLSSVLGGALPAGTQVQFFKADGSTPLTDSNNDQILDIGPVAPGTYASVVVKVTPPPTYTGAGGSVVVTARPVNSPSLSDTTTLLVTTTAASVDLSKSNAGTSADGSGTYVQGTVVQTVNAAPGAPATFQLAITNSATSGLDNFNLGIETPLLADWTVVFYEADDITGVCSNNVITNTGNLAAGATNKICAVVTPPANATAITQDVIFTINSPATGLGDKLRDQVVVSNVRGLSLEPPRSGQVLPGGTITYSHTLTNNGNIVETINTGSITASSAPTANTTLFIDLNNDGIAQSNEQIVNGVLPAAAASTLAKGASISILVKVEAPANATDGQQFVTTVTFTPAVPAAGQSTLGTLQVIDVTTVNNGQVRLAKQQAAANCTTGALSGTYGVGTVSAKPGTCVAYKITASNDGSVAVSDLVISDSTPSFTKFVDITNVSPKVVNATVATKPANGATGTVNTAVQVLNPAASASLEFVVKIDN